MRALCSSCREHKVDRLLIEDAASGQQLIQQLREECPVGVTLPIAMRSASDKITRFEAQASRIEAGMVVLPRTAPWIADFVAEVVGFPGARHDDQADALAQMLAHPPLALDDPIDGPEEMEWDSYDDDDDDDIDPWGPRDWM